MFKTTFNNSSGSTLGGHWANLTTNLNLWSLRKRLKRFFPLCENRSSWNIVSPRKGFMRRRIICRICITLSISSSSFRDSDWWSDWLSVYLKSTHMGCWMRSSAEYISYQTWAIAVGAAASTITRRPFCGFMVSVDEDERKEREREGVKRVLVLGYFCK